MKPAPKIVLLATASCILAATGVFLFEPAKTFFLQDSCMKAGGKWATNGNYCIGRNCAKNGSCLPSYDNNGVCSTVRTGISQDELYFHLGMPENITGSFVTFTPGAMGYPIKATIVDGVVAELNCGVR